MGKFIRAGQYDPRPARWLLQGRIPRVGLTLLNGSIKVGKSLISYDLAPRVTRGAVFPPLGEVLERGGVAILQGEEDRDTIEGRLAAAGADLGRVIYHDKTEALVKLPEDLRDVEAAAHDTSHLHTAMERLPGPITIHHLSDLLGILTTRRSS